MEQNFLSIEVKKFFIKIFETKVLTNLNLCGNIFRYERTLAALAQLDRVFGYEPKGRGFESLTPCQEKHRGNILGAFLRMPKR